MFGGNRASRRVEIERDIKETAENLPEDLYDATASLANDTAEDVTTCTICVAECAFSAVVGDSPEEIILTGSKEVAAQRIGWVARGTLGDAAARMVTRGLKVWEVPVQFYDFATCQCKALD